jgi:hypothetical protein
MPSTIPPSYDPAFENIDKIIAAVAEPGATPEERRMYVRAAVRNFDLLAGNLQSRLSALADAIGTKRGL